MVLAVVLANGTLNALAVADVVTVISAAVPPAPLEAAVTRPFASTVILVFV